MIRVIRVIRTLVAGLVLAQLALGAWAVDMARDRRDAPVQIYGVAPQGAAVRDDLLTTPTFVLLVGSDERAGLDGARADALHLVGLNPALGRATIADIPRDTWVDIPGHGQQRINDAYAQGGVGLLAETVFRLTGVRPSVVITTTFGGFTGMVDALGGIDVHVNEPMDDVFSGAKFPAGVVHMDGGQALAFSRNRHIKDGDLVRTANQGQLIVHALASLRARSTRPTDVLGYLDTLFRGVAVHGVGPVDLYRLGRTALAIDPANIRNITVPSEIGMKGRLSVVFVHLPDATSFFQDLADDGVLQSH